MKKNVDYIGVDDKFVPEKEKYVDDSTLGNKEKATKFAKRYFKFHIGFAMLFPILIIGLMIFMITFSLKQMNVMRNGSLFNMTRTKYNYGSFTSLQGEQSGFYLRGKIDDVITNNKQPSQYASMEVVYNGKTYKTENELDELKNSLSNDSIMRYQVSLDYDGNGVTTKITIKDIDIEEQDITPDKFNMGYISLQGTHTGINSRIDEAITSNKTHPNHIISVIYNDKTYTTEEEIIELEKILDKWTEYYYSVNYDENGYVNQIIIRDF